MMPANRIQRLGKCNEVARDEPCPLMDQLVERVLPVCSRFSPVDGAGIVGDYFTVKCDVFSVALHRQLLQICRETLQILLVRQDRDSLCAEKVVVLNGEQAHENRQVDLEGGRAETLVHLVEPSSILRKLSGPMATMVER